MAIVCSMLLDVGWFCFSVQVSSVSLYDPARFDVAALHNLVDLRDPAQRTVLNAILQELDSDNNWNLNDATERAYSIAGLKRYTMSKQQLSVHSLEEVDAKQMQFEKEGQRKQKAMMLEGALPETTVTIKEEHQGIALAREQFEDVSFQERQVSKAIKDYKNLRTACHLKNQSQYLTVPKHNMCFVSCFS
jgi:hypothetical protein